tara:strand:- start:3525 stop:4103 length:579 start_codon:yes stop_codon:yes gene_type:complete
MKIVINVDMEQLVKEEIRAYVRENLEITTATGSVTPVNNVPQPTPSNEQQFEYEYTSIPGKRRSKCEIVMHKEEVRLHRVLLDYEKAVIQTGYETLPVNATYYVGADGQEYMDGKLCKPNEDIELVEIETEPIELQDADSDLDVSDTYTEEVSIEEEIVITEEIEVEEKPDPEPNEGVPKTEPLTDLNSLFN